MIKIFKTTAIAAALGLASLMPATAATVYATSVTVGATTVTTAANNTNRSDLGNALGVPNAYVAASNTYGGFYSLGIGGIAIFGFGTDFGAPGSVVEVTAGARSSHVETAKVAAFNVVTSVWDELGMISNAGPNALGLTISLFLPGRYNALRLTDMSTPVNGRDGFDVDSIAVSAIPLPAGGLLLIGALGGLALMRRRKSA